MTTVAENFIKTQQLAMPELFLFEVGGTYTRYTSWINSLTVAGLHYEAVPIKRSSIKQDTQMGKLTVDLTCSLIDELMVFAANTPAPPVKVTMRRIVSDDLNKYVEFFKGTIMGTTFKDNVCIARCESNSMILNKVFPTWVCKPTCNHRIFDDNCKLVKDDYSFSTTVSAISGSTLTINGLNSRPWAYAGGYIKTDIDYRMITAQNGDDVDIHVPFYDMQVGKDIEIIPGCLSNPEICDDVYDNLENFLGFTSIPQRNPVIYGMR